MQISSTLAIRLLTHNIRYATTSPFVGEEPWQTRAPRLINELRFNTVHNKPAFICLQEVLHNQLEDVLQAMPEFSYIGVGRDDGKEAGEYSPVLYRSDVWELLKFKPVWLSETPDKPSKGWDAASIRILTVGVFKHKVSGKKVLVLNTHLDDQGEVSRHNSALLIEQVAQKESNREFGRLPVVLSGDFNSGTSTEGDAYDTITSSSAFVDVKNLVEPTEIYGNDLTFTGFTEDPGDDSRIDFIFVRKNPKQKTHMNKAQDSQKAMSAGSKLEWEASKEDWKVEGFAVLANKFDDGVYNSDHRAVVVDLVLQ